MKIIKPKYEILTNITGDELKLIELAGRTCYKSEDNITDESARRFVKNIVSRGHEAMLEHSILSVKFICDRGISHELVRHRLASFAQESTRYCNYSKDKFGNELTFIEPFFFCQKGIRNRDNNMLYNIWLDECESAEKAYLKMLELGATPQEARSILPNSVKTEIIVTMNYREWRHFFKLRAARLTGPAHPQMEEITIPLLDEVKKLIPVVFDDVIVEHE